MLLVLALLAEVGSVPGLQLAPSAQAVFVVPAHFAILVYTLCDQDFVGTGGFAARTN